MKYLAVLLGILLVAGFQDRIYEESVAFPVLEQERVLFSVSFLLIFPITWASHFAFAKIPLLSAIRRLFWKRVAFLLLSACMQLLLFSLILSLAFGENTGFIPALRYLASELLYQYLLVYSVVAWVLVKKEKGRLWLPNNDKP